MRVFSLKNCDTCRKAIKALNASGASFETIDVRADGMSPTDISAIVDGVGFEKALNRRSTTWRGLSDSEKSDLSPEAAVALIEAHPTLLKRPAIMDGGLVTVGWDKAAQDRWL